MKKYYLNLSYVENLNNKSHDIFNNYIKKKYKELKIDKINDLIDFLKNNDNNSIKIICYFQTSTKNNYFLNELGFHLNKNKYLCEFIFFTFDFWSLDHSFFKVNKYKVICFARNIEQLNVYHNFNFTKYKENIIFINYWCCYNTSFIKFNENPIKKLLLSGAMYKQHYPERRRLLRLNIVANYKHTGYRKIDNLDKQNIQTYNLELNKYFACFSSSVYVKSLTSNKSENTHAILLKTFEILAAGSLLVMPLKEEEYIKEIGLENMINCYLIDFSKDIQSQINYIFENIELFNKIRREGQIHAKENLNSTKKIEELKSLIDI